MTPPLYIGSCSLGEKDQLPFNDCDMGGHCGVKCNLKKLFNYVTWPNINREVSNFVRSCGPCQRQAKCKNSKAPSTPLPVIGKPFSHLAYDLVGPYPTT